MTIPKSDRRYAAIRWVAQAVSDDETRGFLRYLHAEEAPDGGSVVVATDGRHLHMDTVNIPAGNYQIAKGAKGALVLEPVEDMKPAFGDHPTASVECYPNWRCCVPDKSTEGAIELTGAGRKDLAGQTLGRWLAAIALATGAVFNADYVRDLLDVADWTLTKPKDAFSAHRFDNCSKVAVIMPLAK